jgi:outer membrane PBP1 activator LpoA protein
MKMATCRILTAKAAEPATAFARHGRRLGGTALALTMALLLSCAAPPPAPPAPSTPEPGPELLMARGDFGQAARLWQQQAAAASGAAASALSLNAAEAWLLANQADMATASVRQVNKEQLAASDQGRLDLVLADLAMRAGRPDEAEALLQQAAPRLPASARDRYQHLLSQLQQLLSPPAASGLANTRALSRGTEHYQPQQALALLRSMDDISSGELALRAGNPRGDQTFVGWLDLGLTIRQNLVDPQTLPQAITAWKGRHPQHFVTVSEALDLWLHYRQQFRGPRKAAVLLPESGRLQAAAEALRDGVVSAFLDHPGGAELLFLSSGDQGALIPSAYFEARDQGADWIIGPLEKTAVDQLLGLAGLATPVMALNELPAGTAGPSDLAGRIQGISFSPDDEARSLAGEMIGGGFRRALVLAPDTEWGERMAKNFAEVFLQNNGQVVVSGRYLESENDYSPLLEQLLLIDASKARKQALENMLQMKLEFEPVRRNDIDVVFLAAGPTQGRSICPQLKFHNAGDIPVYATGRIFSGKPDRIADQDLNGVRFPITPWQLDAASQQAIAGLASLRGGSFAALYALGKDAWNLLPWLDLLQRDPDFRFAGAAGKYRSGPNGRLEREPTLALFRQGLPAPLTRAGNASRP